MDNIVSFLKLNMERYILSKNSNSNVFRLIIFLFVFKNIFNFKAFANNIVICDEGISIKIIFLLIIINLYNLKIYKLRLFRRFVWLKNMLKQLSL